ncbi:MAG: 23S rRNA (uracil(1939)-C(5))-methyltransferase RlmD [Clostridia bacterium]|nr:23S rRNA (uracil(1939)-C(5))-methyltransferase RlmD [Clostridia bacterium]
MGTKATYKKNDIITLKIEDITDLGFGVGKLYGIVVFVADTVPGDVIEAKIIKVNSSYLVARCEKILERSKMRTDSRCDEAKCKSCAYKCISYSDELRLKEEGVRRLFSTDAVGKIETKKIVPSAKEKRYRNKAQYPITLSNGEYEIGFFAPKTHRVTPIRNCSLAPQIFGDIIEVVKDYLRATTPSVYSEESGEGLFRHVYLRRGEVSREILVTLVINGETIPNADALIRSITESFPDVVGIILNVNREKTNVILGDRYIPLYGRDYIYDTLAGVNLKITAPSFYQVNHDTAELLYKEAKRLAEPKQEDVLLDLYCGAGSIGLSMACDVRELIGIEIIQSAVECAKENARKNGIENAHFFTGDAKDTEKLLVSAEAALGKKIKPDIIILDPPRAGCDEGLISFTANLVPRKIVYISCNPKTLARDVERYRTFGYSTDSVLPVDMFPCTGHVESVVCLSKQ